MVMVCLGDSPLLVSTVNTMVSWFSASPSSTMPIVKERCATQALPAALGENAEGGSLSNITDSAPKASPGGRA